MKFATAILPLAALSAAYVVPDEQLTTQIVEAQKAPQSFFDRVAGNIEDVWSGVEESFKDSVAFGQNAIDHAINAASETAEKAKSTFECYGSMTKFDARSWIDSAASVSEAEDVDDVFDHPHHKPHPPPHHGPPKHGKPHHGHGKPNKTVYELIAGSKYTTKLASLINEYPDLVAALNGTAANYTVFAPTDEAFAKIPKNHPKPSKELIKKLLAYHVSPDFYPAGRVLVTHTIPTALDEDALGGHPQRLRVGFALTKGLNINFYSRIIAVDIFGTNGVIHGVDSLLLPPPPALKIIEILPGEFSTLNLALEKTGLFQELAAAPHQGGTLFAPSNWAFRKLGPRINAFLFSKYGEKYLKSLLQYHVVANQTLYSDAFYKQKKKSGRDGDDDDQAQGEDIPKGRFHVDLPTLLEDKSLSVDVARWAGFITIKINGFTGVAVQDGVARDGVIHVVSSVLIPPKTPGAASTAEELEDDVEEFKARMATLVDEL